MELVSDSNSSIGDVSHSVVAKGTNDSSNSSLGELGSCSIPSISTSGQGSLFTSRIEDAQKDNAHETNPGSELPTNASTFENSLLSNSNEWALANAVIEEVQIDSC